MKVELTELSGKNYSFLLGEEKTPGQIVEFLKKDAQFRSFGEILRRIYPGEDLAAVLTRELSEASGEDPASTGRKVRNWLKDKNIPQNREVLFQICFALGIGEEGAKDVFYAASENGIHYRNPRELVYAFGLRTGASYQEVCRIWQEARQFTAGMKKAQKEQDQKVYTKQIREAFSQVETKEQLLAFLQEHMGELGELHNTAYEKFMELLGMLRSSEDYNGIEEKEYSVEEVADSYLRMQVPKTKESKGFTLLQKVIKKHWPNATRLVNICNRKEDVSRKILILLYVITESFYEEEEDFWLEEGEDPDTILEERFLRMNLLLDGCGMNLLDPCNPFDYVVLYAMKAENEDEIASEKMEQVIGLLFEPGSEK